MISMFMMLAYFPRLSTARIKAVVVHVKGRDRIGFKETTGTAQY